jgi:hypothetical protein
MVNMLESWWLTVILQKLHSITSIKVRWFTVIMIFNRNTKMHEIYFQKMWFHVIPHITYLYSHQTSGWVDLSWVKLEFLWGPVKVKENKTLCAHWILFLFTQQIHKTLNIFPYSLKMALFFYDHCTLFIAWVDLVIISFVRINLGTWALP